MSWMRTLSYENDEITYPKTPGKSMAALGSVPSRLAPHRMLIVHVIDGSGWESSGSGGEGGTQDSEL